MLATRKPDLDLLDTLGAARCRQDLFDGLSDRLQHFGIGGFGYGFAAMRTSRGIGADLIDMHFHHTYPKAWEEVAGGDDVLTNDATTMRLLAGEREIDWTSPGADPTTLSRETLRQYEAERDLGMEFGMSLLIGEDRRGRALSGAGLWFAERANAAEFWSDWVRHGHEIRRCLHLFDAMVRGDLAPVLVGLSDRERDALSYLAAGYRTAEASWIMRISEKTFEKHVAHAKEKLNARTRDHAVAKALVMRLIEP